MVKIGFIGMGNMGNAILNGLLKTHRPEDMIFSAAHQDKMEAVTARTKVPHAGSNRECAKAVKYLILAVKPQYFDAVFSEIRDVVTPEQVVISLAPRRHDFQYHRAPGRQCAGGKSHAQHACHAGRRHDRYFLREGSCTEEEKETVRDIFSSCGRVEMVEERLMDAVGCVSGSSPAFVYMFIEALADGGVKYGLPRKTAYAMAAQTVLGSAKMILETGKHPGQLKDEVCSPGGTTIAGVSALEEHGLRNAVIKAADACYEKTQSMK